jgi:hypothetical protein
LRLKKESEHSVLVGHLSLDRLHHIKLRHEIEALIGQLFALLHDLGLSGLFRGVFLEGLISAEN